MEFSCGKCGTRYAVPDEKVRGKRVRTRCRKCGAEILIDGPPAPSGVPKLPPPPAVPRSLPPRVDERWTVTVGRNEQRKMTTAEIVDAYATSAISDHNLVWKPGMETWKPPFEIPAIALALTARGVVRNAGWREPGRISLPSPPSPPSPPSIAMRTSGDALASDWDDEDEATRVSTGALPFVARMLRAEPSSAPRHTTKPPLPRRPPTRPPPEPVAVPLAPYGAAFSFDDEATEVIAPDRARALLEAQEAKDSDPPVTDTAVADTAVADTAVTETPVTETPVTETPIAFGFDDEPTEVIAPDRAEALLLGEARKKLGSIQDAAPQTPAFPGVESAAARPPETGPEPSIVVAEPKKPIAPEAPKKLSPVPPNQLQAKDIIRGFQNEPTRVVRAVKKKKTSARQVWMVVVLALVAAAAGGFIASEILARQHAGMRPRAP